MGVDPPAAKKFFLIIKKNAKNVLKQKNMQTYFVKFLQGYPLITLFSYNILFSGQNHPFQACLVSKTYIYIYMLKQTCINMLTARGAGGGVMALTDATTKFCLRAP